MKKKRNFRELSTVESLHNELVPEEFSEDPYAAATNEEKLVKTSP